MLICCQTGLHVFFAVLILFLSLPVPLRAQTHLSILMTSNLQGKFSLDLAHQETSDPLLLLGQDIVSQRNNGVNFYIDLGNALYPGILSKYSSGAIMMDFLDYFGCRAALVSSKDLQIGAKNLEFLQKSKKVRLLSSNIMQGKHSVFTPWVEIDQAGTRIALLGLSSSKIRFDVAEKDLYGYGLSEDKEAIKSQLNHIRMAGIQYIILLSGQTLKDTANLLQSFPDIGMAICGGDDSGRFFSGKASRVDLVDGRSILIIDDHVDYHVLNIAIDDRIRVQSLEARKSIPIPTSDYDYQEFKNHLSLWKEKFLRDEQKSVADLGSAQYKLDDRRFAQLLRDRFNCELGVVEKDTINPLPVTQDIKQADFLGMVNRDYNIFIFTLTGDQVRMVQNHKDDLVIAGLNMGNDLSIQGYPVSSNRRYHVAASQPALQQIKHLLGNEVAYHNTWMTVTDLLMADLKHDRIIFRKDYDYLDRRFRTTIDAYLSNFIDSSSVNTDESTDTPPGQPTKSYNKWGLENKIDFTIYNKYHRFVITPYMLYSRQDDSILNNILRGIFLYDYNLEGPIKPYGKLQCDTVVEEVNGLRPVLLRGTLGFSTTIKNVGAKFGFGIEKEVQDPSNAALYGVEFIANGQFPLFSHFSYAFNLDTFAGIRSEDGGLWQIRSEINNGVVAQINSRLGISLRHKFFYLYDESTGGAYRNSQFLISLDVKTDWKFW